MSIEVEGIVKMIGIGYGFALPDERIILVIFFSAQVIQGTDSFFFRPGSGLGLDKNSVALTLFNN